MVGKQQASEQYPPALEEMFRLGMEYHRGFVVSIQAMDTKAFALMGIASLVLSLFAAGGATMGSIGGSYLALGMLAGAVVCFLASVFSIYRVMWVRNFHDGPSIQVLLEDYWDAGNDDLKYNILYHARNWEQANGILLDSKARWLSRAMVFTAAQVVFLALWLAFSLGVAR